MIKPTRSTKGKTDTTDKNKRRIKTKKRDAGGLKKIRPLFVFGGGSLKGKRGEKTKKIAKKRRKGGNLGVQIVNVC